MQHKKRIEAYYDSAVENAIVKHFSRCAEPYGDRTHQSHSEKRQQLAEYERKKNHHGKELVRPLFVPFAHDLRNERRSACAYHEPHAAEYHDKRHYEIYRGERGLTGVVRNKKTVYHAVNGNKHHHYDCGKSETQKFFVCKAV